MPARLPLKSEGVIPIGVEDQAAKIIRESELGHGIRMVDQGASKFRCLIESVKTGKGEVGSAHLLVVLFNVAHLILDQVD